MIEMPYEKLIYLCFIGVIITGIYLVVSLPFNSTNLAIGLGHAGGFLAMFLGVMGIAINYIFRDNYEMISRNKGESK